jgi:hypothetical protein
MTLLSVVIHDFNPMRPAVLPNKTHPPLIVDSDAVLTATVVFQCLQLVTGRDSQTGQLGRCMQLQQLAPGHALDIFEPAQVSAMGKCWRR